MSSFTLSSFKFRYLTGATIGPILFSVSHKLPFVVMAVLNIILIVVVGAVYVYRLRILSAMEFDDDVEGQYLLMERANNNRKESPEHQEMDKVHVSEVRRMVAHSVTASDVPWIPTAG